MPQRVKVSKNRLARIQEELKEKGYTLDDISSKIGSDFKNFRYKGHSMDKDTFRDLKNLVEREIEALEIEYIDGKGEIEGLNLEKTPLVAELFGIILGDGYLQSTRRERKDRFVSAYRTVITLHSKEEQLKERTCSIFRNLVGKEPQIYRLKNSDAVQIVLNSKEFIRELEKLGLETGNKVENQVEVPDWIIKDKKYEKRCLRGLVDTDGAIYRQSGDNRAVIQFKNHSVPLLQGFAQMCADLNIGTSSAGNHAVQVAQQEQVKKFIEKVEPLKASYIDF